MGRKPKEAAEASLKERERMRTCDMQGVLAPSALLPSSTTGTSGAMGSINSMQRGGERENTVTSLPSPPEGIIERSAVVAQVLN